MINYRLYQCIDPNVFILEDDDEGVLERVVIGPEDYDATTECKLAIAQAEVLRRRPELTASKREISPPLSIGCSVKNSS